MGTEQASEELANAVNVCHQIYVQIYDHLREIESSAFYTTYAECSVAQGKTESFIRGAAKKVAIGAIGGLVIACGLWFLSALMIELRGKKEKEESEKEVTEQ